MKIPDDSSPDCLLLETVMIKCIDLILSNGSHRMTRVSPKIAQIVTKTLLEHELIPARLFVRATKLRNHISELARRISRWLGTHLKR
jgi:hypothetical protein